MTRFAHLVGPTKDHRRIFAAFFLVVLCSIMASSAFLDRRDPVSGRFVSLCDELHHTSPSADCPHKKRQGLPTSGVSTDASQHAALLPELRIEFAGDVADEPVVEREPTTVLSRRPGPPLQPPKHA